MITFTGIIFSAVFVAAQIQTSSYSPRLAARLRRDRVIIAGLALPTATASYSLFALASIGREIDRTGAQTTPALTVGLALVLTFVTFGAFVALVQRAFDSTQIGGILRGLLLHANRVIEDVHPERSGGAPSPAVGPLGGASAELHHHGPPAVLASVDRARARAPRGRERRVRRGGPDDRPVHRARDARAAAARRRAAARRGLARRVLVLARQRSMDQDPAFALRMFVDIAIRALSPAVNDPTTAVQTLDRIETLLVELHGRDTGPSVVLDERGEARGRFPAPSWGEYVDLGLIEIRHYGGRSAQVARRLRALHSHLLEIVSEAERERVELERRLLDEALAASFPDESEREILSRPDRLGLGSAP